MIYLVLLGRLASTRNFDWDHREAAAAPLSLSFSDMTARLELPATHQAAFGVAPHSSGVAADAEGHDAEIDAIIDALRRHTGLDARAYRRPTVERRIRNRMISVGEPTLASYARRITDSADEASALLERVSIKVSEFYRNADVFARLHAHVLPTLAASTHGQPLRIWSAGCGRGEEPWTLAMLLHDLNIDAVVEATDIDPSALAFAQRARYKHGAIGALPSALANRYLVRGTARGEVHVAPELRHIVRFSMHDLLSEAPPTGNGPFDLICCRNVMIYFQRAAQERTFDRLEQSLSAGGVLCVGEAEWPCGRAADTLIAAASRNRIFHRRVTEHAA